MDYYLLWIHDSGDPGAMYGPSILEDCKKRMEKFIRAEFEKQLTVDDEIRLNEGIEKGHWHPNDEDVGGWHIVKCKPI